MIKTHQPLGYFLRPVAILGFALSALLSVSSPASATTGNGGSTGTTWHWIQSKTVHIQGNKTCTMKEGWAQVSTNSVRLKFQVDCDTGVGGIEIEPFADRGNTDIMQGDVVDCRANPGYTCTKADTFDDPNGAQEYSMMAKVRFYDFYASESDAFILPWTSFTS